MKGNLHCFGSKQQVSCLTNEKMISYFSLCDAISVVIYLFVFQTQTQELWSNFSVLIQFNVLTQWRNIKRYNLIQVWSQHSGSGRGSKNCPATGRTALIIVFLNACRRSPVGFRCTLCIIQFTLYLKLENDRKNLVAVTLKSLNLEVPGGKATGQMKCRLVA